jgi:hypothetical protein
VCFTQVTTPPIMLKILVLEQVIPNELDQNQIILIPQKSHLTITLNQIAQPPITLNKNLKP